MFKRPTAFILGAGASAPYGFSTGGQLLDAARRLSAAQMHELTAGSCTKSDLAVLYSALEGNMLSSIDAMLEHRKELRPAGKKVMAALLLGEERIARSARFAFDDDWLAWIFEKMAAGADTIAAFLANPVYFITFNYDRSLEYRFLKGLAARYNTTEAIAWTELQKMRIVHVHGSLGPLSLTNYWNDQAHIPYGGHDEPDINPMGVALPIAEKSIQIIHDISSETKPFEHANALILQSEQAVFLGFGFAQTNVQRLRTSAIPQTTSVYCSVYGMTDAEIIDQVFAAFPNHSSGSNISSIDTGGENIRLFLRNRVGIAS